MFFLALKTYRQTTGAEAIKILSSVKKISEEYKVPIIAVAQPVDIYRIKKELDIEVWAQHVDPIDPGKNTGWISPYSVKNVGATGTLINHSEHKISDDLVNKTNQKAKNYGLKTLVIGHTAEEVINYDSLDCDLLGYEKEDLIASPVSMIDQQEESIKEVLKKIRKPLIIGAGINDGEDVRKSVAVGAVGVILATAFVSAPNPEEKLRELAEGFIK